MTIDVVIDESYHYSPAVGATKAVVLAKLGIADPTATTASLKTTALFLRTDGHVSDTVTNLTSAVDNALDWYESAVARPALVLADLAHKIWPAAIAAPADGCAQYFRDVLIGEMPTVNSNKMCDSWSAAENKQTCLNNAVLASDANLSYNAVPPSPPPRSSSPSPPPPRPPPKSLVLNDYESSASRYSVVTALVVSIVNLYITTKSR